MHKPILYFSTYKFIPSDEYHKLDEFLNSEPNMSDYSMVIINQTPETTYNTFIDVEHAVDKLIILCKPHNVPVKLLTTAYKYNPTKLSAESENYPLLEIIDEPGYWLSDQFFAYAVTLRTANERNGIKVNWTSVEENNNIEHLYITMNNIPREHRCIMMDMLAKHDLIDLGKISWRDVDYRYTTDRNDTPDSVRMGYPYKYWTPKRMFLNVDTLDCTIYDKTFVLPKEYAKSAFQLVAETSSEDFFLTEKIAAPLYYGKLFLVIGCKNFYANLVDMGFKLYDNVFDYSFDSVDDLETRIEMIVSNINKYRDYTNEQLTKLILENKDVIEHNHRVVMDYVFNRVPESLEPIYNTLKENDIYTRLGYIFEKLGLKNVYMGKV